MIEPKSGMMSIPFLTVPPEEDDWEHQRLCIAQGMPIPPAAMLRPGPLRDEAVRQEAIELAEKEAKEAKEAKDETA